LRVWRREGPAGFGRRRGRVPMPFPWATCPRNERPQPTGAGRLNEWQGEQR
jgi:hypothetical protein